MREVAGLASAEAAADRSARGAGEDDARHPPRVPAQREGRAADDRRGVPAEESRGQRGSGSPSAVQRPTTSSSACSTATRRCRTSSRVAITGPYNATGPGDTPSRRASSCAIRRHPPTRRRARRQILSDARAAGVSAARRQRARTSSRCSRFYQQERDRTGSFEAGIEMAPAPDPGRSGVHLPLRAGAGRRRGRATPYRISDTELASRLSFFLWSSIPDEELLKLAIEGKLHEPAVLEQQTRRMLGRPEGPRARHQLRRPVAVSAGPEERQSRRDGVPRFRRQPASGASSARRRCSSSTSSGEDRSVLDLLDADYTFVNERLARHYGIPNVYGPDFRRVPVPSDAASRAARARQPAAGHVESEPDVAGDPRHVDPREPARQPAAAAAAGRARLRGEADRAAANRFASASNSTGPIRRAPAATRSWTPSGWRSRTSTPSAAGARRTRGRHRRLRRNSWTARRRRPGQPAEGAARSSEAFVGVVDGEAAHVRRRPRDRATTCRPCARSCARRRRTVPLLRSDLGVVKSAPFQMARST